MSVKFRNNKISKNRLFDDFRIYENGILDTIYVIFPVVEHKKNFGKSEVWGQENDFRKVSAVGSWNDILAFFGVKE